MVETEKIAQRNKVNFMQRYRVKQADKSADLEGLLGYPVTAPPPVFLDHRSLFDRDGQSYCLTAELYAANWPSEEAFKKLGGWCRYYGLKYEEVKGIESWYSPARCRVLMIYKDPHANWSCA